MGVPCFSPSLWLTNLGVTLEEPTFDGSTLVLLCLLPLLFFMGPIFLATTKDVAWYSLVLLLNGVIQLLQALNVSLVLLLSSPLWYKLVHGWLKKR